MKQNRSFSHASSFVDRQRAQITRLRLPAQRVRRDSLLRRLDRLDPLTLLQSLPGTGKTTVLADWAVQRMDAGDTVIWVSASSALNSLAACRDAIAGVVLGPAEPAPEEVLGQSLASSSADREASVGRLCAEHPRSRVILVIDGTEQLTDPPLRSWLYSLVRAHPNLHLVGSSDTVQPLSARSPQLSLNLITGQHLMIPRSHAAAFAASWGHDTAAEEIDRLYDESGGWLLLMRTMLDTPVSFIDAHRVHGMQRFREDFLADKLNLRMLSTAAPMALLESVSAELMDDVYRSVPQLLRDAVGQSGHDNVQPLIDSGMLRPAGSCPGAESLQFPRAVRSYLAHLFTTTHPGAVRAVHAAAAAHYERAGRLEDIGLMLEHGRRAGEWDLLNRAAAQQGWWLGARHPEVALAVFGDLPAEARAGRPVLLMSQAAVRSLPPAAVGTRARSALMQRVLADAADLHPGPRGPVSDPNEHAFLAAAALIGLRRRGDYAGARHLSQAFRDTVLRSPFGTLTAINCAMYYLQSGLIELAVGDLERAVRRFTRAYEESTSVEAQFVAISAAAHNALIFAYEGRRTVARQWLEHTAERLDQAAWARDLARAPSALAAALLALDEYDADGARIHLGTAGALTDVSEVWAFNAYAQARFALLFDSPSATLSAIDHAVEVQSGRAAPSPLSEAVVARARCDLLIAEGELNRAQRVIAAGIGEDPSRIVEADGALSRRSLCAAQARLWHVAGNHPAARRMVSSALSGRLDQRTVIDLLMIDTGAAWAQHSEPAALRSFRRAIALTRRSGAHTAVLSLDRGVRRKVLDLAEGERSLDLPGPLQQIMATPGVFPAQAELVVLTEREQSVLQELAGGASIPDVARSHVLSVNTVKKQTVSLYRKLGTDNRADAVRRAHELGLLG